jgi:purine-binding chemotaxis protein CheW
MSTNTATQPQPSTLAQAVEKDSTEVVEAVTRYVVVNVNGNLYGMDTDSTVEMMSASMTQITRVPHSLKFISGVINHRGTIIPVIDARGLLGFQLRGKEANDLKSLFRQLEADHVNWLKALEDAVVDGTTFEKATDPNRCNFGRWFNSVMDGTVEDCREDLLDPTVNAIVKQFDVPHKRIHSIASQVLKLRDDGESAKALEIINSAREKDLAVMCSLFAKAAEAIDRIYESMLVITEHEEQKAAIMVDGVSFVVDCKDNEIEPLPDTADNTEFLTGLVHRSDGTYILITDLASIYSHACVSD